MGSIQGVSQWLVSKVHESIILRGVCVVLFVVCLCRFGRENELDWIGRAPVSRMNLLDVCVDDDAALPFEYVYRDA